MKEKEKKSSLKNFRLILISFFLAATIFFLTLIVVADITLFNDREVLSKVSQITYSSQLNSDITLFSRSITAKYGVDYSAVSDVITPSRIDTDMVVYFNSISSNDHELAEKSIDETGLQKELYGSFVSHDKKMTKTEKKKAEKAASLIAEEYKKAIVLEKLQVFYSWADKYNTATTVVFFVLLVAFFVLAVLMVINNSRRKKHRLLRKFSVVFCSAGLTMVIMTFALKLTGIVERISFPSSEREYNIFVKILDDFMNSLVLTGGGWLIVGIILMTLWYFSVSAGKRDSLFK